MVKHLVNPLANTVNYSYAMDGINFFQTGSF